MPSILNPLHGADIEASATKLAEQNPLTEEYDREAAAEEEKKQFHCIIMCSMMVLVTYISGAGLYALYFPEDSFSPPPETRDVGEYLSTRNIFHHFFCKGIKTSKSCF